MKHNVTLIAALLLAPLAVGTVQAQDQPFGEALKSLTNSTLNMHLCPRGKWEVGEDKWGQIVRVNMLKIEDADWEKVPGVKKAWRMKGFEGVAGMAFHPVISEVKDVDADGKPDIFRLRSEQAGAKIERLRYDDGSVVWESGPVGELYGDEGRLAVYELNGPKDWCVFHADKSGVYCFDAATGQSRWNAKVAGGTFTVGHFLKKDKASIAFHDGGVITCLDESGKQAWQYDTRLRRDNAYSHELLGGDADGDGLDELFVNTQKLTLALRGDGKLMWEDKTQMHHSDFLLLADVDGDGRKEFIYDHFGCGVGKGPVLIVDALTGQQKASIDYSAGGVSHAQKVVVGKFDSSRGGMQIAICGKPGGITLWDVATGELIWKHDVPAALLSKGDWDGDGNDEIMAFGLGANVDGVFSVWNGKGERLYALSFLPSPSRSAGSKYGGSYSHAMPGGHEGVRRQVDLDGNGRADVIMPFGGWHWGSDSILFLMEGTKEGLQKSGKTATK